MILDRENTHPLAGCEHAQMLGEDAYGTARISSELDDVCQVHRYHRRSLHSERIEPRLNIRGDAQDQRAKAWPLERQVHGGVLDDIHGRASSWEAHAGRTR